MEEITYKTGDNTRWHKWHHNIKYLWCLIYGHNTFCGFYNDGKEFFDHCRRCEKYNSDHKLKSLNLWARYTILVVNSLIFIEKWNKKKRGK